jgi:hypothetical protein
MVVINDEPRRRKSINLLLELLLGFTIRFLMLRNATGNVSVWQERRGDLWKPWYMQQGG